MMLGVIEERHKPYFLMRELIKKDFKPLLTPHRLQILTEITSLFLESDRASLNILFDEIEDRFVREAPRSTPKIHALVNYLRQIVVRQSDVAIVNVIAGICFPLSNAAIKAIPSGEVMTEAKDLAKKQLLSQGDSAIPELFSNWDSITYHACLAKENDLAVKLESDITSRLNQLSTNMDSSVKAAIKVACLQEFERRAGQKRKQRAGEDLQQAVQTVFEHIGVNFAPNPSLVTGTLEADLIVSGNSGWKVIVSCKRTGRERVKQVSVDQNELLRNRITKVIWFFTEFDQTNNRVTDLGIRGSIFYLPDDSSDFQRLSSNAATAPYVRPLSGIRESIREFFSP